jgi:hypothetical protein
MESVVPLETKTEPNRGQAEEMVAAPSAPVAAPDPSEAAAASSSSRFGVLRHRHCRNVGGASFVSNVGNWMEMVGLQMFVATLTGSLQWLGYLGAAQLTPILVLGTLGGLVAAVSVRRRHGALGSAFWR